ncbi:MAG: alpha-1,4-glucan--maltose-1-phosphate maltosyltransferase [Candidatus Nanopelagicales bacterium]
MKDVWPVVEGGDLPAKAVVDERMRVRATALREGHDKLGVSVVVFESDGSSYRLRATPGYNHRFSVDVRFQSLGLAHFQVEAWDDVWGTWVHAASIKIPAGIDVDLELKEGALLLNRALQQLALDSKVKTAIQQALSVLQDTTLDPGTRLQAAIHPTINQALTTNPLRNLVTVSKNFPILVERRRALYGSWYEFFPRSEGAKLNPYTSGTFKSASARLEAIADMGFHVVYLPPIHPIGTTHRKGKNNSLLAEKNDVGSPWAIGSKDGGHDAVHPDLGTLKDFDNFVQKAQKLGIEIALDLALQASPDHPWVKSHPSWFKTRADGSIAYAENPPKKYQDIYPLHFDTDPEGLFEEIERIVRFWMNRNVRIFRVDNPHTKPVWLWQRLIRSINRTDPDVIFLSEAFTTPNLMRILAEVGFQQSYTYFTWKNDKQSLIEYVNQLSGDDSAFMRPNFFVNTPDILPEYLQHSGPAGFAIRATLASTLSPTWGVYSGFELYESTAHHPGSEEYIDSEKYELKVRDWKAADRELRTLAPYIKRLNELRRDHPALQTLRDVVFHATDSPHIIAYSKTDRDDTVLVICTLDTHNTQSTTLHLNMPELGFDWNDRLLAHDLITDTTWTWHKDVHIELNPFDSVAHIITLRRAP